MKWLLEVLSLFWLFSINKIVKRPRRWFPPIGKHLSEKGVKSSFPQSSFSMISDIWAWVTTHKARPGFLLLTRALALLSRNSPSPESFWRLSSQSFNSSAWYQAKCCTLGYFCMNLLFPQTFPIPRCFYFTKLWEANTCDSWKGRVREVLNS